MDKPRTKSFLFLLIIFAAIFLYSAYMLYSYYANASKASKEFDALRNLASATAPRPSPRSSPVSTPVVPTPTVWEIIPRFTDLYELNTDFIGWIKINGTNTDYPVMQSSDEPELYLKTNFNREYDVNGTPFLDARCSIQPNSDHMIVYGHNMKSRIMFHYLTSYGSEEFWRENQYILFDTLYGEGTYQIFAAFIYDVTLMTADGFQFHRPIDFESEEEFRAYIDEIKSRSLYDTGITPEYGDELLTLATCEYSTADSRFVVVGLRVD